MGACLSEQAAPAVAAVKPAAEAPIEAGGTVISLPASTETKPSSDAQTADPETEFQSDLPHDQGERRASVLTSGTQTDDEDHGEQRMLPALPSTPGPEEDREFDVTAEDDGGSSSMVSVRPPGSNLPGIGEYTTFSASPGMRETRSVPGSAQQRNRTALMRVCSSGTPSVQMRAISETMQGRRHPMAVQMMSPQSKTDATGRRPVSPRPGTSSTTSGGQSFSALLQPSTEDAATLEATKDRNMSVDGIAAGEDPTPGVETTI